MLRPHPGHGHNPRISFTRRSLNSTRAGEFIASPLNKEEDGVRSAQSGIRTTIGSDLQR